MVRLVGIGAASLVLISTSAQAFVLPSATATRPSATPPSSDDSLKTDVDKAPSASRLEFLRSAGMIATSAAGAALLPKPSSAEEFTDDVLGFKFQTPDGWERGEAQISGRRKIIVYTSPKNPGANAFVAYTPVRGDFTTLGSFGTLDEVSKTVLPEAEGVKSRMVDSYAVKNCYVYDYVVSQEGRPEKHIKGQLATITAQCNEEDYPTLGKSIDKVIASVAKTD
eukprot:jgi/Undpi1/9977/HiC_scaffold_28.g12431.m1